MSRQLNWMIPMALITGVLLVSVALVGTSEGREAHGRGEIEKEVSLGQVPAQVKEIIIKQAAGHEITEIEETTKKDYKIYEAEWLEGGKEVEIEIVFVCKLVKKTIEMAEGDDEEDGDEDIIEIRERDVSFNQVPAAVRDAIIMEAGKNRIDEIEEVITDHGKFYEAEWNCKGWEVEAFFCPEGKLVRKEMSVCHDDDDEDDDDDDDD